MKLAVFGATGVTGREIAAQALDAGHAVTAFVRSPAKLGGLAPRVRVVAGNVAGRAAVEAASAGQDAALVALGAANPFRRMPSLTVGMHNILMALEAAGVPRLVYLSADTVDRARLNFLRRRVIVPLLLAATAADHQARRGDDPAEPARMGDGSPADADKRHSDGTLPRRRGFAGEHAAAPHGARQRRRVHAEPVGERPFRAPRADASAAYQSRCLIGKGDAVTSNDMFSPNAGFRHRKDAVNGIALHSVVRGEGPVVLLLHGWPQTWWEWRHVMPSLAEHRMVVAVDLRGFGDSERPAPERGYDAATLCADLVGLLDVLGASSASVVGHDLGGLVAYALARLHPERVDRLALADAPLPLLGPDIPAWSQIEKRLWHQRFHRVPYLPEQLIAGRERLYLSWHFAQTIQNVGAITARDLDEYVRCYSVAGGLSASFAFGRAIDISAEQVRAASRDKMSIPLLFFGGAKSLAGPSRII